MATDVSVVVPVYNPGAYIEDLIDSLLTQSMPVDRFEVIFVDDGSTDGTERLLDDLAARHDHFCVLHIPNSGWPGRPRNLGVDAAQGTYVQFVDNDDVLGDEALERLVAYAEANSSDVVVGREVRRGLRRPPPALFSANRPYATLEDTMLLQLLTPHKMFRRQFLIDNALRFFEGPRRLEDHPFVVAAYFAADVISVLADYTCYYWLRRPDDSSAGQRPMHWTSWYANMGDALDVVDRNTRPGDFRNRLLVHWYRTKGLQRLGAAMAQRTDDDAMHLLTALHNVAEQRFPPAVDVYLRGVLRVRSTLLRAGRYDDLRALSRGEVGLGPRHTLVDVSVVDGVFDLTVETALHYGDGSPVTFRSEGGRSHWNLPVDLDAEVESALLDFTEDIAAGTVEVSVLDESRGDTYAIPTSSLVRSDGDSVIITSSARIDPRAAAFGPLHRGRWELNARTIMCGWEFMRPIRADTELAVAATSIDNGVATLFRTPQGTIRLRVGDGQWLLRHVSGSLIAAEADLAAQAIDAVTVRVPVPVMTLTGSPIHGWLRLKARGGGTIAMVPAELVPTTEGAEVLATVSVGGPDALADGRYRLAVVIGGTSVPLRTTLVVSGGSARLEATRERHDHGEQQDQPRPRPRRTRRALSVVARVLRHGPD